MKSRLSTAVFGTMVVIVASAIGIGLGTFANSAFSDDVKSEKEGSQTFQADQTPEEFKNANDSKISAKGTGIFLVAKPESEDGPFYDVVVVGNLTYDEFKRRGNECSAMKWIPESKMTLEEIKKARKVGCGQPCPNGGCRNIECICSARSRRCV